MNGGSVTQTTHSNPTVAGPPPHKSDSRRGKMTLGFSALALLVAVLALSLSLLALITAHGNDSATSAPQQGTGTVSAPSTIPSESNIPTETSSDEQPTAQATATDAPLPTAAANYTVSYQDKRLSLQPNGGACGGGRDVDLDQPAINVSNGSDIGYTPGCTDAPSLNFESDKVATVVSPNATPEDCAENIQLNAASQKLTPSQDQVICAVTDGQGAPNQPARAKIARIVVSDVGQDQKVTLNVTAWEIPY